MSQCAKIAAGFPLRLWLAALTACLCVRASAELSENEVVLAVEDFKKLDPFEVRSLSRADKAFTDGQWRQALAEYDVFMQKYPKSVATAYAIMRKGRSLQHDNKRFEAIKVYNDVMDFFPDIVEYAAPTIFYIGECQWGNGNKEEALKTWKEIAEDVDYRKHRLAAHALNALAGRLLEQGQAADAAKYYLQVAVDFRDLNRDASYQAIRQLIMIHMRIRSDIAQLREACKQLGGFEQRRQDRYANDEDYFWGAIRGAVREFGQAKDYKDNEAALKDYYRYWAGVLEKVRPTDDDLQKDAADFRLISDGKGDAWVERLDKQFQAYQKPDDYDRIVKWIAFFAYQPQKREEYYAKLVFTKMKNESIRRLLFSVLEPAPDMAASVYSKLRFNEMNDEEIFKLGREIWWRAEALTADTFRRMKDENRGRMEELRFWRECVNGGKAAERGLPLADQCVGVPAYAREAYWIKGQLLRGIGRIDEAIQAYQMTDDPPKSLYAIADCLLALGRVNAAVEQLREIENFFGNEAPRASLQIANVYLDAGKRDQGVAELRGVLKKYPGSSQSSAAHNALEAMGLSEKIGGGKDAD